MGAVFGFLGKVDEGALRIMGSKLMHRGRDTREWVLDGKVYFGERIPSSKAIPLAHKGITLVADADIYNQAELKLSLEARGRTFETDDPEEVIIQGYLEYGLTIFSLINGDFAFALWDSHRSMLILARDHLGSRPLYYWKGDGKFAFASEYKALVALPEVPVTADLESIQVLQYTKYPPVNRTLLKGILSVPPGSVLEYHNGKIRRQSYYDIEINVTNGSLEGLVQDVRQRFLAAVDIRLEGLTKVGVTLSGGIDSAAVVAAIRHLRPELPVYTFTCGNGSHDPEINGARIVAEALNTEHHEVFVESGNMAELLPKIVWHLEDPIARSETIQIFEVAKVASQYVHVVLSGYVSDGLFAGMAKHKIIRLIQRLPWMKLPLQEFYDYTQVSTAPKSRFGRALHMMYYRGQDAPPPAVMGAARPNYSEELPVMEPELLNQVLKTGLKKGTPKWLPKVDRLHMAHGLNIRSPYTDINFIRHAFQISDRHKIQFWREKHILREAVRPLLPPEVLNRRKFPQTMNHDHDFSEALEKISDQVLSPARVRERGFFDAADIERLRRRPVNQPYSSEQSMRLWTAMLTELWAVIFLDQRGEPVESIWDPGYPFVFSS